MAGWARNRVLADVAVRVVSTAESLGLRISVLKGLGTEARWYDRMGERPSYDVDIAVHPGDTDLIPSLVEALHPNHSLLEDLARLIGKGHLQSLDLATSGMPIDLHWDPLKLELIKTRRPDLFWDRVERVELSNGGSIPAFDPSSALILHLLHLNKDRFRYLLGFADIARILNRAELDWEFMESVLAAEGLRTPVATSLAVVVERLQLPEQPFLAAGKTLRARAWHLAWPAASRLMGKPRSVRQSHRQFLIPLTGSGRILESLRGYLLRLIPPPKVLNYYYPHARGRYLWKLVNARSNRRSRRRRLFAVPEATTGSQLEAYRDT